MRFADLLRRKSISVEDFSELFPEQKGRSLSRTANYWMKPLVELGIARKNGKGWKVRHDYIKVLEKFEELREKTKFEGNLYEFISEVFRKTLERWKNDRVGRLAEEHGVSKEALEDFLEELLDCIAWRTGKDLKKFLDDFRSRKWVYLSGEVLNEFKKRNVREIARLVNEKGLNREEAVIFLLNRLMLVVPLSIELWKRVLEDAPDGTEVWVENRLAERKELTGVELVPVNKTLWVNLQNEVSDLLESQREALKLRLTKRLNDAVEKTIRDAKEMKKRVKRK